MAGRKPPLSSVEPRLGGIRIQTSLYGQTVPVVFGRARIPGNLVWYGGFKATQQEERSEAAKGGASRPSRTYYAYSASAVMLLAEGPLSAVRTVYKGKQRFSGQASSTSASSNAVMATVPSSAPYTVTIPNPSEWAANVYVVRPATDPSGYPPSDMTLVEGVDYTAAAGVYTFQAASAGAVVAISWTTQSAAAGVDALGQLGLTLAQGQPGQAVWQYLASNFPAQAVPYSGFAYVRGQDYALTNAAEVENHGFEVDGPLQYYSSGDARPGDVIRDMLTSQRYGVGWASGSIGDWSSYLAYCDAYGLKVSPAFTEQRAARDWISDLLEATNTDASWNGAVLRLIPRGDENAGSYTAPTTPVFDLGPDDFLADDGEMPLRMRRSAQVDVHNIVRVEYANRGTDGAPRDYILETVAAEDEASIALNGQRPEAPQAWHFFCDGGTARQAAYLRLQRKMAVRNQYECTLPWRFAELEPGDLVTLTDSNLSLVRLPARVVSIEEAGDDTYDVVAEDFPIGHATAPIVAPQIGSGFRQDFNADPGAVATPMFVEPPGGYTQNGLEVWVAISGQSGAPGQFWGGAEVYASLDGGSSYKLVGRVDQGARYGALASGLSAGTSATLAVQLAGRGGLLRSVSAAEADALSTLMFVGTPETGEFVAFESAALTGANAYSLTKLRRARFGTADQAASAGTPCVYVDGALAMSGPLPIEMIGKTIKFKFCSFNVFGGGLQQLSEVTEYSYVVTGRFRDQTVTAVSANLLKNATFEINAAGWSTADYNVPAGSTRIIKRTDVGSFVPGSPSSMSLAVVSGLSGENIAGSMVSTRMSIDPRKRYVAYAWLISYATRCNVMVSWYTESGAWIRNDFSNSIEPTQIASGGYWNKPENYALAKLFAAPPSNAAQAELIITAGGAWLAGEPIKYLSVYKPFFGPIAPGVTDIPEWDPGGHNVVDTELIAPGSVTEIIRAPRTSGAIHYLTTPAADYVTAAVTAAVDSTVEIVLDGQIEMPASTQSLTVLAQLLRSDTGEVFWSGPVIVTPDNAAPAKYQLFASPELLLAKGQSCVVRLRMLTMLTSPFAIGGFVPPAQGLAIQMKLTVLKR